MREIISLYSVQFRIERGKELKKINLSKTMKKLKFVKKLFIPIKFNVLFSR